MEKEIVKFLLWGLLLYRSSFYRHNTIAFMIHIFRVAYYIGFIVIIFIIIIIIIYQPYLFAAHCDWSILYLALYLR